MTPDNGAWAWTDAHAHLFDCPNDELGRLVDEAVKAGVGMIVNTAVSIDTARTVLDQCKRFPKYLKAAVGISPFDTVDAGDDWADRLMDLLKEPIIAIGEIGLDQSNPRYPSIDIQMPFFKKQLEIATGANLPAFIHSRGIEKKTAEICRDAGIPKAIFHCFTGDRESMEYILESGYYVSISGIITYKNSHLRDIIRHIPINRLLIETDAPYLSPTPRRGKQNRPAFLVDTAKEISKLSGVDEPKLAEMLMENWRCLF